MARWQWEEESGTPEDFPLYYEMFAEVCERAGRFDEGLDAVRKGLAQAERGRIVYWNAELHRRRGELMLAAGADPLTVVDCFERALADAQAQGALSSCCAPPPAWRASTTTTTGGRATRSRACGPPTRASPAVSMHADLRDAHALLATTP